MSDVWESIAGDYEQDKREPKDGEYSIPTLKGSRIVCTVPGLRLGDFYRSSGLLSKECGVK